MLRAGILSIMVAGLAAAAAGCGGDGEHATQTAAPARDAMPTLVITKTPAARTGRQAYREARAQCRVGKDEWLRHGMTQQRVVATIASDYDATLRWFARLGCRDAFSGKHHSVDSW